MECVENIAEIKVGLEKVLHLPAYFTLSWGYSQKLGIYIHIRQRGLN